MKELITLGLISLVILVGTLILSLKKAERVNLANAVGLRNAAFSSKQKEIKKQESIWLKQERMLQQSGTGITLPVYYLIMAVSAVVIYMIVNYLVHASGVAILA